MKNNKAFTLIELLLGLSIFSLIVVCLYSTLFGGIQLSHRSQKQGDIFREVRWALSWMSKDLENMVSYNFSNSYPDKSAFMGDAKQITFIMPTPDGLKVISYYLAQPQEGSIHRVLIGQTYQKNVSGMTKFEETTKNDVLIREEKNFIDYLQETDQKKGDIEIVASNVKEHSLKISYAYQETKEGKNIIWKDNWVSNDIPRHIRIQMDFQSTRKPFVRFPVTKDIWIPSGILGPPSV